MTDPTFDQALQQLSVPATDSVSRRRFLQGAVAAATASAVIPWTARAAAASLPTDAGVVVVVLLGGGNDPLNTIVPTGATRGAYEALRPGAAIPVAGTHALGSGLALHPSLRRLATRYAAGEVAVVMGTGASRVDLSHFTATATLLSGTDRSDATTGWLGRYLDALPSEDDRFPGIAVSASVPLHLIGQRPVTTTLAPGTAIWGADRTHRFERATFDAVEAFAAAPTGLGHLGDAVALTHAKAMRSAARFAPVVQTAPPNHGLVRDLRLAARVVNADVGARVIGVTTTGYDTHARQPKTHATLLTALDDAIAAFYSELQPAMTSQVTLVVVSEFGRRAASNGSAGTDHGWAGHTLLVGRNVRGGLHGTHPSLTALDPLGNLVPTVDTRSVYATVLERWLRADASSILGSDPPQMDLFIASPGAPRPVV